MNSVGTIRIANHLRQAFAVAQVDEDDAAVVTATMCPAAQGDDLPVEGGVELSAIMGTHEAFRLIQVLVMTRVCGGGGATTPIEMMYLSAASTVMSSSTTSCLGIIRKNPEVGLGVVGT